MKKTLAALALATTCLLPAASAWAGGETSDAWVAQVREQAPPAPAGAERLIASGCHDGRVFIIDFSTGTVLWGTDCTREHIDFMFV